MGYRHHACHVSIHAPRVEGDYIQSVVLLVETAVSIHAPRVEGDEQSGTPRRRLPSFNPRPPGGGRPQADIRESISDMFQSTPPGWRATRTQEQYRPNVRVSIHAPRVEGDPRLAGRIERSENVSIHAPRVEGDQAL